MKKSNFYLLHLMGYFIIQFISVYVMKSLFNHISGPLIIFGIFFALSIASIFILKKYKVGRYIISIILSSISSAGIIAFILIQTNTYLNISSGDFILLGLSYIVITIILFVIYTLIMKVKLFKSHPVISLIFYSIILLILIILLFNLITISYGVGLIIYVLSMIIYIITMLIRASTLEEVYKNIAIASLGIIIVVIIIALIILSEGDGDFDGIESGDLDGNCFDDIIEISLDALSNISLENPKKRGIK